MKVANNKQTISLASCFFLTDKHVKTEAGCLIKTRNQDKPFQRRKYDLEIEWKLRPHLPESIIKIGVKINPSKQNT